MKHNEKKKSEQYFDEVSKQNKKIMEPIRCYPIVLEEIKSSSGTLLDVGCGEGVLLGFIEERCSSNLRLYGIDLSGNAVEKAKKTLPEGIDLRQGDAEHLPYDDNMFDVILCTHSFHHYPNPNNALREFNRCLKKNGRVFIVENYRPEIIRIIHNGFLALMNHPKGDIKFYSQRELERLIAKTGFDNTKSRRITEKSFILTSKKH